MLLDGGTVTVPLLSETETPVRSSVPVLQTWPLKLTLTVAPDGVTVNVSFSGQVCNTGTDDLTGVSVSDSKGTVTVPPSSNILIGACSSYSGGYSSTTLVNTDTATASGTGVRSHTAVSNLSLPATCSAAANPSCSVNKNCATNLVADNSRLTVKVTFDGQVCNTG